MKIRLNTKKNTQLYFIYLNLIVTPPDSLIEIIKNLSLTL
jgi:hypothetical protein